MKTFDIKSAMARRLPSGKSYKEATLDDWKKALDEHRAEGRYIKAHPGSISSVTKLAWKQADGDYRYYLGVINEDRQARGLPLIEI